MGTADRVITAATVPARTLLCLMLIQSPPSNCDGFCAVSSFSASGLSVLRCPPESTVCWFWHDVDSQYIEQKILVNVAKNCIFLSSELCPICISNFRARFVHCFSAFIQNLKMFADRWHPAQGRFPIKSLYIAQIQQNIALFPIILCLNPRSFIKQHPPLFLHHLCGFFPFDPAHSFCYTVLGCIPFLLIA